MKTVLTSITVPAVIAIVLLISLFVWYGCRIEPGNGQIAVLIRKTGKNLPQDAILAPSADYKGVQLEVLGEGRCVQTFRRKAVQK